MSETWRLLIQPLTPRPELEAAFNMAIDEAMVMAYRQGGMPPTLRLYTWNEPALTIGYFQAISDEVDWAVCQAHKIPVVRRITGGRAVLHGQDLTYSVVAGPEVSTFSTHTIRGTFLTISRALLRALEHLGLEAESVSRSSATGGSGGPLCFASPSWYEITYKGRKLIGSAQRRWREGFLQQGSVLLSFKPEEFYRLFRFPSPTSSAEARRLEMIKAARSRVAGLNDFVQHPLSYKEVKAALILGFEEALGVVFKTEGLTPQELESAYHLTQKKYSQDAWNRKHPL